VVTQELTERKTRITQTITVRPPGFWPREAVMTGWLICLAGAILRVRAWLHWRSLWLDEIYLAHSVLTRSLHYLLFRPLDFWQAAPAGFLVVQRISVHLFGTGERSLRLPSLLASLAALPMFYALARRILTLRGTLISLLLFACLGPLIYYSEEAKQYATDVFWSLAILLSATSVWRKPDSWAKLLLYASVCAVALFSAIPAIFVVGGTAFVLLAEKIGSGKRISAGTALMVVIGILTGLELLNVYLFLRPMMHGPVHDGLYKYWLNAGAFPPNEPDEFAGWLWKSTRGIIAGSATMYIAAADLGMLAALAGVASLIWRGRATAAWLLVSPLPLGIAAALLRRYPFGDRLTIYLVPAFTLLMAAGVDLIWGSEGGKRTMLGMLMAAMLIGGSMGRAVYFFRFPVGREETEQAYQWIRRYWRSGDLIVMSRLSAPSFDYYAPKVGLAGLDQLWQTTPDQQAGRKGMLETGEQGIAAMPWFYRALAPAGSPEGQTLWHDGYTFVLPDHTANPGLYLDEIDGVFAAHPEWRWPKIKRVWVVFAHDTDDQVGKICLPELDRKAQLMNSFGGTGVLVDLYQQTGNASAYQRQ
jgi:hypothetical protein